MTPENSTTTARESVISFPRGEAYDAARDAAILHIRTDQARLSLTGADRVAWLQGLVTNDVALLKPGEGCYAALLNAQGRMITDLRVVTRPDQLLIDLPAAVALDVRDRLEMFVITEDVVITDRTRELVRLSLHGAQAVAVLARALAALVPTETTGAAGQLDSDELVRGSLASLSEHASVEWGNESLSILVVGSRELGVSGFDLYVAPGASERLTERLLAAGAVAADEDTWEVLRIEAGTPRFGRDMTGDTIPLEAGIEHRAISFSKGCYVGQEVIVRVMHRGHGRVARRLSGLLTVDGGAGDAGSIGSAGALAAGNRLWSKDGREVGRVTSAAYSPRLGRAIALGYVLRDFAETGTLLEARSAAATAAVTVSPVPFVSE